ncbi:MAG: LysM peptidoglycan-binding domain-containing protein [Defluviitaleaceae bacterium]|nr:LysM peptidoglycan-binding domain-containing protein [Defluviitaleaceae bacterium]
MKDFTLPANIKQIGGISDGLRVYMEDYVCTFLQQYAESAGFEERLAFLVGKQILIDGQQFLFISGAIYGKYAEKHEGHLRFTEKSVDYAEEMLEEHFPNTEIVGWMQSQPSYGTYLNQYYGAYHLRQFRKAHQVMFVVDPLERTNAFYLANPVAMSPADRMTELSGYFIYYEKNTNMHEYMLVNKSADYTTKSPTLVEFKPVEYVREEKEENFSDDEEIFEGRFSMHGPQKRETQKNEPEEIIRRRQNNKAKIRGTITEQKKTTNLLAGLCGVLFVISFIMGVGLIRNQDRLDNNDAQIRQLTTALRNIMTEQPEHTPVFAEEIPEAVFSAQELPNNTEISRETTETNTTETANTPEQIISAPTPAPAADATIRATMEESALISPIPETYTIQPGDSLLAISLYFFGDANMVNEILWLNGIENPDHIIAGKTIALPRR